MDVTFYGQSCFSITINDTILLVDPAISENPLTRNKIDIDSLQAHYILITHAHSDHIADVERIAKRTKAKIIANYEIANYYGEKKLDTHPMNYGGTTHFDFGSIKCVVAVHSSQFPNGRYGGNPCGYVISSQNESIYIAGDTGLTMDMKLIPMFFKLNLAILPLGDTYTMGIEEAVVAAQLLEVDTVIGCHYDSFPILKINHNNAKSSFKAAEKDLLLLDIGQIFTL